MARGPGGAAAACFLIVAVALAAIVAWPRTGWGWWSAPGAGQGGVVTGTLSAPSAVTATVLDWSDAVSVSWQPAATSTGADPEGGYEVTRVREGDGVATEVCPASAGTTSTSCEDTAVPDGVYRYEVTAIHRSWTATSAPSDPVGVDADVEGPTVGVTDVSPPPNAEGWHGEGPVTVTVTAQDTGGSGVVSITHAVDGGPSTTTMGDTVAVEVSGEGVHTITYSAVDTAGHESAPVDPHTVRIDTTPPAVTVQQAAGQVDPTNTSPVHFAVTFSEPVSGFTDEDVALSGTAGATSVQVTGSGADYVVAVAGLAADGTVVVAIPAGVAHDPAGHGNTASTSTDDTVVNDTTAPPAPSAPTIDAASDSGSSSGDGVTNVTAPTFIGTAEPGSTVTVHSDGVLVGSGAAAADGTYAVTSSPLGEGSVVVTAAATDLAGNAGPVSAGSTVTIDTTPPESPSAPDLAAASDSSSAAHPGASDADDITNVVTPTLIGTAEAGTTVTVSASGTAVGGGTAADGAYAVVASTLGEGTYVMTATATDVAGNTSAASPGTTITIDATAPTVAVTALSYSTGVVTATGTAGIAAGDATSVTVVMCAQDAFPCAPASTRYSGTAAVDPATGAWSASSGDLRTCTLLLVCSGPGAIHVQATQVDVAGNTGTSTTLSGNYS